MAAEKVLKSRNLAQHGFEDVVGADLIAPAISNTECTHERQTIIAVTSMASSHANRGLLLSGKFGMCKWGLGTTTKACFPQQV